LVPQVRQLLVTVALALHQILLAPVLFMLAAVVVAMRIMPVQKALVV
jgi:hypothetical protein